MQTVRATHERCGKEVVVDMPDDQDLHAGVRMTCPTCDETFTHHPSPPPASGGAPARAAVVGLATTSAVSVEDALLGRVPAKGGSWSGTSTEAGVTPPREPQPDAAPEPDAGPDPDANTGAANAPGQGAARTRPPAPGAVGQPGGAVATAAATPADARAQRRARRARALKWIAPALILIGIALLLVAFATQRSPLDQEPETQEPPRPTPNQQRTAPDGRTAPRSDADSARPSRALTAQAVLRA